MFRRLRRPTQSMMEKLTGKSGTIWFFGIHLYWRTWLSSTSSKIISLYLLRASVLASKMRRPTEDAFTHEVSGLIQGKFRLSFKTPAPTRIHSHTNGGRQSARKDANASDRSFAIAVTLSSLFVSFKPCSIIPQDWMFSGPRRFWNTSLPKIGPYFFLGFWVFKDITNLNIP
jgi:hypothetical protein